MSKSILGVHRLNVHNVDTEVEIFQAEGVPEAGHLRYSMVIKQDGVSPYAVTFDGYESNRIVLEFNSVFDDESEDEHFNLEAGIIREAMFKMGIDIVDVSKFFDCAEFKLEEGSLVPMGPR